MWLFLQVSAVSFNFLAGSLCDTNSFSTFPFKFMEGKEFAVFTMT